MRKGIREAQLLGITGVPFFVIDYQGQVRALLNQRGVSYSFGAFIQEICDLGRGRFRSVRELVRETSQAGKSERKSERWGCVLRRFRRLSASILALVLLIFNSFVTSHLLHSIPKEDSSIASDMYYSRGML